MKALKKFIKLRKQNDSVKMMLIFGIVSVIFFGTAVVRLIHLYQDIQRPVEYIVTGNGKQPLKNYLVQFEQMPEVRCASLQNVSSVNFYIQGEEASAKCYALSYEYLQKVYALEESSAMQIFYINVNDTLLKDMEENEIVKYEVDGESDKLRTAKIRYINSLSENAEGEIFCTSEASELSEAATSLRICMKKNSLNRTFIKQWNRMGLHIENQHQLEIQEVQREKEFAIIKYQLLLGGLSLFFVFCLIKYGKPPVLREISA